MTRHDLPTEPLFGEPVPQAPSPDTLDFLARRRSASATGLTAPGPGPEQVRDLIRLAARVPDHGKLFPWRFVVIEGAAKAALVERLRALAPRQANPDKATASLAKLATPPVTILVVFTPAEGAKIPEWEQILSAGAVCQNLLIAAGAMGFGANWITDWYAYDPEAVALLGLRPNERVAGFMHVGTAAAVALERPRPDLDAKISVLSL